MTNKPPKPPSSTKLLFQLIQCLHHLLVLNTGSGGAARAFGRKARELDGFIRPAMPTQSVSKKVREVNDGWVKNMTHALITHYQSQMDFLQGALKASNLSPTDLAVATQKAKQWATRNFGKRLQMATLSKFDQVVKNLGSSKPSVRPTPPPKTTPTKPGPNPTKPAPKPTWGLLPEVPEMVRDAVNAFSSKRRRSLSAPDGSSTQAQAAKRVCTSPKPVRKPVALTQASERPCTGPKPVQKPPSFADKAKSPPRANSSNRKPAPKAPRVFKFPHLKPAQRGNRLNSVWEIPRVTKDILVLGDSNLSRVSHVARDDAHVLSYPGLKLQSLLTLLQGFKFGSGSPNPGRKPGRVVLSVGINDKSLTPGTNKIMLNKVVNEAIRAFPTAKICLAQIAYSVSLDLNQKQTIAALNKEMEDVASKKQNLSCIPLITKSKFSVDKRDNIHWTEDCANATINHFFNHLN